jgi:hypothetical protein
MASQTTQRPPAAEETGETRTGGAGAGRERIGEYR